jgi:hypothetical protein
MSSIVTTWVHFTASQQHSLQAFLHASFHSQTSCQCSSIGYLSLQMGFSSREGWPGSQRNP